jgi:2,4-dienoyl-CoA reductase (NADPH2)
MTLGFMGENMLLFEPYKIGNLELMNRIIMAPVSTNLEEDGFVGDRMIRFYEERAKGATGLITIGDGIIDAPIGNNVKESLLIDDDKYIPALRKLTEKLKQHGSKTALQISHSGRRGGRVSKKGHLDVTRGLIPVAPSAIAHPVTGQVVPRELTREEIREIVKKFGEASRRTVEAGFDAIGLHCAHMYLCGQFLSPWSNQRQDEYGKDFEGRMRFVLEVVHEIKAVTGKEYPLIVRMNGEEPDGGNSLDEIQEIARRLEKAGVDAIHVSVGFGAPAKIRGLLPSVTPMRAPHGCIVPLAENIKKAVTIPVVAVNKLGDIHLAEQVLQEKKADLISMGRPLIADPYLPDKGVKGAFKDIRPCISCSQGCLQNVLEKDAPIACSINAAAGREEETEIIRAKITKTVLILGAGPAGLQAAETAAMRGHRVVLLDKAQQMGGQLLMACRPPGKGDIEPFKDHLVYRVKKLGVEIILNETVSPELLERINPDAAIIATGSAPVIPSIPGLSEVTFLTSDQVLQGSEFDGKRVVVIGGGSVGCEVAELLCEQQKKVTVIEILDDVARDMDKINKLPLIMSLEDHGVRLMTKTRVESVTEEGVWTDCLGEKELVAYDALIVAVGRKPRKEQMTEIIRDKVKEVFEVGDGCEPRGILDAVREGFDAATKI